MKTRIFLAVTIVSFVASVSARSQEPTVNFFYDNLTGGSWIDAGDYGYCFQPDVAANDPTWRPYSDGYWAYTDAGWTWVSYEDFGWATYHYGRWANLADVGWVWVPGFDWAPAWVSWRTGGDYVGWAPLPPEVVYEGGAIGANVDVQFDIGPQFYNFVDIRYIGEPVLRGRLIAPQQNVTIINRTVNITNITVNNTTIINNGPNFNRINQYSARPIQRLTLIRTTSAGRGNFSHVNGGQLTVLAPAIQKPTAKVAPPRVKKTVAQPRVKHGWSGVANQAQVQAAMKKENPRSVPPPTLKPQRNRPNESAETAAQSSQPNELPEMPNTPRPAVRYDRNPNVAPPQQQNSNGVGVSRPDRAQPAIAPEAPAAARTNDEKMQDAQRAREQQMRQAERARERAEQQRPTAQPPQENGNRAPQQHPDQDRQPSNPNAAQARGEPQEQGTAGPNAQQHRRRPNEQPQKPTPAPKP